MRFSLSTTLALLAAGLATAAPALAQEARRDAKPFDTPAAEQIPENRPNWPSGLENWDSQEWDPKNVNPQEAERRGLLSPEVRESVDRRPTEQGMRSPSPETAEPQGQTDADVASGDDRAPDETGLNRPASDDALRRKPLTTGGAETEGVEEDNAMEEVGELGDDGYGGNEAFPDADRSEELVEEGQGRFGEAETFPEAYGADEAE